MTTWRSSLRRAGRDTADLLGGHYRPRSLLALALYLIPVAVAAWRQPPARPIAAQIETLGLTLLLSTTCLVAAVFVLSLAAAPARLARDARRRAAAAALTADFARVLTEVRELQARLGSADAQERDVTALRPRVR